MPLRARTKTACEIARIDPQRFNEMIHAGHYNCAPETRPGSARIFDLDQIVALRIFGKLISMAVSPDRAGHIACAAYSQFSGRDDVRSMVYMVMRNGAWHMIMRTKTDTDDLPEFCMVFDIPGLRDEITEHLEYEDKNRVVGED